MSEANMVWIAVAAHANAERQAVQNLNHQGCECYCPYSRVLRRHAGRSEMVNRPFFPGYLFVRLDLDRDQWRPIMYSRGVRAIVRFGDELGIVPDGVVEGLLAREEGDGLKPPPASERLRVGQQVSLHGTLFDDFICTVESIKAKDQICVLLEMRSQRAKANMPANFSRASSTPHAAHASSRTSVSEWPQKLTCGRPRATSAALQIFPL